MLKQRAAWALFGVLAIGCGSDEPANPKPDTSTNGGKPAQDIQSGTLLTLKDGKIQGDVDGGVRRFRGIPYAKPPVGSLRWKAPVAPDPWSGTLQATAFGTACAQMKWLQGPASDKEDCLYLNVWTPEPAPAAPLPVMVWLPGGGNQNGAASDLSPLTNGATIYDGRDLAGTRHVVVVTLNYRLGVMGFFSHPGLRAEGSPSGNQGLLDQRAALTWVKSNIIAFGGDPKNVTLFGESAGSQDTCLQLFSPGSRGLFQRAISQSGGCTTFRKLASTAETQASIFAEAVGCKAASDELACLRDKPVGDLIISAPVDGAIENAPGGTQFNGGTARWDFNPVLDGDVIPDQPRKLAASGNFTKVPYLLGSNDDEGRLFLFASTAPVTTKAEYDGALGRLFGATNAPRVAEQYPVSSFASPQDALIRVWGDYRLVCTTTDSGERIAAQGVPVHFYNFARRIPGGLKDLLRATHGVELPYVFGTLFEPPAEDQALSDTVQGYWTRFAASGDPNGESALDWPAFTDAQDRRMNFDAEPTIVTDFRRTLCDFWQTIYGAAFQ